MEKFSENRDSEADSRANGAAEVAVPAERGDGEIVVTFIPASEIPSDHRFKAGSQVAVLFMGMLAATATVLVLSGLEHLLSWAIEAGLLSPPPGPETYSFSILD